jgi:cytochrome b subunit of formate dehydrogenase
VTNAAPERHYQRFSRTNRVLHVLMILSFISLASTGLTLKFSYTRWAHVLSRAFGGFESAGTIHRFAATVMFGIFFVHLFDLLVTRRKTLGGFKALLFGPETMLPRKKDLRDVAASLKWFLGKGPRPHYGRWTYWEKFDYMAVFWGIAVIGSTGLMLWFPEFFTRFLPGSLINVATIIHSDEALLATGFIFTVHFFNTHFRPERFPMDPVIFTGVIPLSEFKAERPREYREAVKSGRLDAMLTNRPPDSLVRGATVFGLSMLALGLVLIGLILYAMYIAYR